MKIMFLGLVAAVSASALTPTPVDAQRGRDDRGWHDGRDRYEHRGYHRERYRHGRRWRGRGMRTVCRWRGGGYGRHRVCYRVRR